MPQLETGRQEQKRIQVMLDVRDNKVVIATSALRTRIVEMLQKHDIVTKTLTDTRGGIFELLREDKPPLLASEIKVQYDPVTDVLLLTGMKKVDVPQSTRDTTEMKAQRTTTDQPVFPAAAGTGEAPALAPLGREASTTELEKLKAIAKREQALRVTLTTQARLGNPGALLLARAVITLMKIGTLGPKDMPTDDQLRRMVSHHARVSIISDLIADGFRGEGSLKSFKAAMPSICMQVFEENEALKPWVEELMRDVQTPKKEEETPQNEASKIVSGKVHTMQQILAALESGGHQQKVNALRDLEAQVGSKVFQHACRDNDAFKAFKAAEALLQSATSPAAQVAIGKNDKLALGKLRAAVHEAIGTDTKAGLLAGRMTHQLAKLQENRGEDAEAKLGFKERGMLQKQRDDAQKAVEEQKKNDGKKT